MERDCEREVVGLHDFLRDWLTGALPREPAAFARFERAIGAGLLVVSPLGRVTERAPLLAEFEASHGALTAERGVFEIWIENCRCRRLLGEHALVTYEEWHRLRGATSARLTTALFAARADAPCGVEWLHVHETWLPGQAPPGGERFPQPA